MSNHTLTLPVGTRVSVPHFADTIYGTIVAHTESPALRVPLYAVDWDGEGFGTSNESPANVTAV